jgi:hypothetical protein
MVYDVSEVNAGYNTQDFVDQALIQLADTSGFSHLLTSKNLLGYLSSCVCGSASRTFS